jgi:hypothetical protein
MESSIGGGSSVVFKRAAPRRTSSTATPDVDASAWLTRRMQDPQCIPSIRREYSDITLTLLF